MDKMIENRDAVNKWMERFGVRFGVYKNGVFKEQLFPFDAIPRVITKKIGITWKEDSYSV